MLRSTLIATVVVTSALMPSQADDPTLEQPEIRILRGEGAIYGRVRPQTDTSKGRIPAVSLGVKWKGGNESLKVIPAYSVTLVSLHKNDKVSDTTLEALRGTEAKYIMIHHVPITDKGLDHIATMTGVKTLTLKNVPVTDEGIPALARMKNLKRLNLWATQMSSDGVSRLRTELPECEIHANWW